MDQEKFEKAVKNAKWFAVGLMVLAIIVFVLRIVGGISNTWIIATGILEIILIIATIKGLSDEKLYGAICGIVVSALLILSMDIISLIFGILYLIDCIKIVQYMKNNQ